LNGGDKVVASREPALRPWSRVAVDPATILQQGTLLTTVNVPALVHTFAAQFNAPPPAGQFAVLAATDPSFFVYAALDVT
jgi:hypothetical protein